MKPTQTLEKPLIVYRDGKLANKAQILLYRTRRAAREILYLIGDTFDPPKKPE